MLHVGRQKTKTREVPENCNEQGYEQDVNVSLCCRGSRSSFFPFGSWFFVPILAAGHSKVSVSTQPGILGVFIGWFARRFTPCVEKTVLGNNDEEDNNYR